MVKDNRRYYLDLKENSRGRFLRVSFPVFIMKQNNYNNIEGIFLRAGYFGYFCKDENYR